MTQLFRKLFGSFFGIKHSPTSQPAIPLLEIFLRLEDMPTQDFACKTSYQFLTQYQNTEKDPNTHQQMNTENKYDTCV